MGKLPRKPSFPVCDLVSVRIKEAAQTEPAEGLCEGALLVVRESGWFYKGGSTWRQPARIIYGEMTWEEGDWGAGTKVCLGVPPDVML